MPSSSGPLTSSGSPGGSATGVGGGVERAHQGRARAPERQAAGWGAEPLERRVLRCRCGERRVQAAQLQRAPVQRQGRAGVLELGGRVQRGVLVGDRQPGLAGGEPVRRQVLLPGLRHAAAVAAVLAVVPDGVAPGLVGQVRVGQPQLVAVVDVRRTGQRQLHQGHRPGPRPADAPAP